jgi:hypothetical protein
MNRVKCLFIPQEESKPVRGMEIAPYKGAHEIFNAVIETTNGTVARAHGRTGTLLWIDDETKPQRVNHRATSIAGQEIAGHAVVFQIGLDGELTDVDYDSLGLKP